MDNSTTYNKVAAYCARAERCPKEVENWLEKHEVPDNEKETIIKQLKQERFISEERFIAAFSADKLRFNYWGPLKIKQELITRNLPENLIERIVPLVMEENNYLNILEQLIIKRIQSLSDTTAETIQRKVIQWAYGKGFSFDDTLKCLHNVVED